MPTRFRYIALILTLGLGLVAASCDKGPTRPSVQTTGTPGALAALPVVRIAITVPDAIDPGASAQLTANAIRSDGSVENVTGQTQWTSTNARVIQVSSAGIVTGGERGEANLNARYQNRSATARMMVLPGGTFRLIGQVTDGGFPIEGVTVVVLGGTGEGLTTLTGPTGAFALYGVGGQVRLQAKKEGYLNRIEEVLVTEHRSMGFEMTIDGPRRDLHGTYTLTVIPNVTSIGCPSTRFPDSIQNRSYIADVEQSGPKLTVRLSGADFIVTNGYGDHFSGFVSADGKVTFNVGDAYYYYYYYGHFDFVERLNPASALLVKGTVNATSNPTLISGLLEGSILVSVGVTAPFMRYTASCFARDHRFEMRRR
jgi:hypothetical protein